MRNIVGIFATICGAIAVIIVARYGYVSADTRIDGLISAFLFGAIAAGGLGGHAVAVRVWRHNRIWALVIGFASAIALLANLTNSVGYIAGRDDKGRAERSKTVDLIARDKAELARIIVERKVIGLFTITTQAGVDAAQSAVASAERIRKAECEQRGPRCRERELEEQAARNRLVEIAASKATTGRAAKLDDKIAALRAKLAKSKPVESVSPHADALSLILRLFQVPKDIAESASTLQQFFVAAIVELLIVLSFVAFELMGREPRAAPAQVKGLTIEPSPSAQPKLIVSNVTRCGSVPDIMAELLEPAAGALLGLDDAYTAYAMQCESEGLDAVPPDEFGELLQRFCAGCGIAVEDRAMSNVTILASKEAVSHRGGR